MLLWIVTGYPALVVAASLARAVMRGGLRGRPVAICELDACRDPRATQCGPVEAWAQLIFAPGIFVLRDRAMSVFGNALKLSGDDATAMVVPRRAAERVGLL